eukprot:Amastigsp_a2346_16.p5 type:complete len:105 gc:universal Amastigsp_a2346_16:140-454(+)
MLDSPADDDSIEKSSSCGSKNEHSSSRLIQERRALATWCPWCAARAKTDAWRRGKKFAWYRFLMIFAIVLSSCWSMNGGHRKTMLNRGSRNGTIQSMTTKNNEQ